MPNDVVRCELLLALGDAESAAGDSLAAKKAFLEAAGIAQRASLGHHLARAAAGYGGRMPWARAGDADRLVPLLEKGSRRSPAMTSSFGRGFWRDSRERCGTTTRATAATV